jgi:hypothetical protein
MSAPRDDHLLDLDDVESNYEQHRDESWGALQELIRTRPDVRWSGNTTQLRLLPSNRTLVEVRCPHDKGCLRAAVYPTPRGPLLVTSGRERSRDGGPGSADLIERRVDDPGARWPLPLGCKHGVSDPLDLPLLRETVAQAKARPRPRAVVLRW